MPTPDGERHCPQCDGVGVIDDVTVCLPCWRAREDALRQDAQALFWQASGLTRAQWERGASYATKHPAHRQALEHLERWLASFAPPTLVVLGGVGVGKTRLTEVAARRLLERGVAVRWLDGAWLASEVAQGQDRQLDERVLWTTPALILDDIGPEVLETSARRRVVLAALNARMRSSLPTLMTSNAPLRLFRESDPRLGSRLLDRSLVAIHVLADVPDMRLDEARERWL